ncbi:MAG: DUF2818 family protein [Methylibium sp.]|uniref:DUF2818 family protein n=1 Tax=Methylibium sp. TaxID=2067992 RepID=UPI0017E8124B|nr:DUF2818 family protein [Methylibium sp.]MBA2723881.1 DUF2818 family protein [Methylibium sp.]MBA3590845.1 DUF2818 family protein [Methylibium sp.]MBA3623140.1 DUF2818 family protein [Methylibium sp.]
MTSSAAVWVVLALAVLAANLPFVNERLFVIGPLRAPKNLGWRLLELLVFGAGVVAFGMFLEARIGQRHPQGWEFYAIVLCLFLTLAFPGFVWRVLRRRRG